MILKLLRFYKQKNFDDKQEKSHQRGQNNKETKRKQHIERIKFDFLENSRENLLEKEEKITWTTVSKNSDYFI